MCSGLHLVILVQNIVREVVNCKRVKVQLAQSMIGKNAAISLWSWTIFCFNFTLKLNCLIKATIFFN